MTTRYEENEDFLDGFVEGQPIHVVEKRVLASGEEIDGYTYECLTYKSEDDGVRLTYIAGGTTYRVFVPTRMIRRIFQEM